MIDKYDSHESTVDLPERLIIFYNKITEKFDLSGKSVLEIGCGDGRLLKQLAIANPTSQFVGVDFRVKEMSDLPVNLKIIINDATNLSFSDNSFDYVFSIAVFEHIHDLEASVSEINRVLKPYGILYSTFAPIWTSIAGHHNMPNKDIAAPWAQLYMNEEEYMEHLLPYMDKALAKFHANTVYNRKDLNRLTRRDYYDVFINSKMIIREIREFIRFSRNELVSELTPDIAEKIKSKYCLDDIGVTGFTVCLEKYLNSMTSS